MSEWPSTLRLGFIVFQPTVHAPNVQMIASKGYLTMDLYVEITNRMSSLSVQYLNGFARVFGNMAFFVVLDELQNDKVYGRLTFLSSERSIASPSRSAHIDHLT